jgi:hypothetical protein
MPLICERQKPSVVQLKRGVCEFREFSPDRKKLKPAGHAKVCDEHQRRGEINQDVLTAPVNSFDASFAELL